jgi:hypothetical protein
MICWVIFNYKLNISILLLTKIYVYNEKSISRNKTRKINQCGILWFSILDLFVGSILGKWFVNNSLNPKFKPFFKIEFYGNPL